MKTSTSQYQIFSCKFDDERLKDYDEEIERIEH